MTRPLAGARWRSDAGPRMGSPSAVSATAQPAASTTTISPILLIWLPVSPARSIWVVLKIIRTCLPNSSLLRLAAINDLQSPKLLAAISGKHFFLASAHACFFSRPRIDRLEMGGGADANLCFLGLQQRDKDRDHDVLASRIDARQRHGCRQANVAVAILEHCFQSRNGFRCERADLTQR